MPPRHTRSRAAVADNRDRRKLEVTPFNEQVKDKTRFPFPVTTSAADITALMNPRMAAVRIGTAPVSSLTTLNDQLNKLKVAR